MSSELRQRHTASSTLTEPAPVDVPDSSATPSSTKPASQGSRITLIGLCANVGLTISKGVAGWALASPALLADAAHSGSDLVADLVTLSSYKMSRRNKSAWYPWGFGKYESLGSVLVAFLLITTAFGLAFHAYAQLLEALSKTDYFTPEFLAKLNVFPAGHSHDHSGHDHDHHHDEDDGSTDPRAMLFAGASVLVKEWLYQITMRVAKREHSNVLMANALHHRSDAIGSLVALAAIGGAYLGFPILDPLGGLAVAAMILKSGAEVGWEAFRQLVDEVIDPSLVPQVHEIILSLRDPKLPAIAALKPLAAPSSHSHHHHDHSHGHSHGHSHSHSDDTPKPKTTLPSSLPILAIPSILIHTSGPSLSVFVKLVLPPATSLGESDKVVDAVSTAVKEELGEDRVGEVWVVVTGKE